MISQRIENNITFLADMTIQISNIDSYDIEKISSKYVQTAKKFLFYF